MVPSAEAEFASADGTISVMLEESWEEKDAKEDGWIGASSKNGMDAVMVIQSVKEGRFAGRKDVEEAVKTVYGISGLEESGDTGIIPGLTETESYRCKLDMEGTVTDGYIVYGETDYAYYAFIYAAKDMDADTLEYVRRIGASFREDAPERVNIPAVETTDTILWMNGTYAVLTTLNGHDYTIFGGTFPNSDCVEREKEMLDRQWGVTDRASADESLDWLRSEGHRTRFVEEMDGLAKAGLASVDKEERVDFLCENNDMTQEEAERYARFYEAYEEKGEDAISAWDYSRLVMLLSSYYVVGYYSETEALEEALEVSRMIQKKYGSWDTFTDSYMMGYEYWAKESSDYRRLVYEILQEEPDSPYRLPWDMKLVKDW